MNTTERTATPVRLNAEWHTMMEASDALTAAQTAYDDAIRDGVDDAEWTRLYDGLDAARCVLKDASAVYDRTQQPQTHDDRIFQILADRALPPR